MKDVILMSMSEQVPATPPANAGAAPGNNANVITPPSTVTPPAVPEGKVTIETKEYAQLQRDAARGRSAQRRADLGKGTAAPVASTGNADVDEAIREANQKAADAELRATQAEIRGEVRDLLEKDEFKVLPKSTKDLILKNPAMLSEATTKEEALLDIEDYVRDQVAAMGTGTAAPAGPGTKEPDKVETPPSMGGGAPAAAGANQPEDLTNLRGPARSQAAIRNALKGVKQAA